MADVEYDYAGQDFGNLVSKIQDLEEKQRMMKDRLLLIGTNLVELKEDVNTLSLELKKEIEDLKRTLERTKSFIENASEEFSKFAHKEDLEILTKQAKMFQPLEFVRKKDLKELNTLK